MQIWVFQGGQCHETWGTASDPEAHPHVLTKVHRCGGHSEVRLLP